MSALSSSPTNNSGMSETSSASVEIQDFLFCMSHGREVCADCQADYREDNSFTAGLDHNDKREGLEANFVMSKDGEPNCKKHKLADCKSCYGFKKAMVKLNKDASKAAAKSPKKSTNLY